MTAPLTSPDADLQDFPFMPLHVARLRDSDLAAEGDPEGCWYAVLLWAAAWHQLPAGSLPDNDAVLTKLCGLGRDLRTFKKHRHDALRGFVRCDDGRLYHPVIAEQVTAAWESKLRQRHRTECAAIKQRNVRHKTDEPKPTFAAWLSRNHPESVTYLSLGTDDTVTSDKPQLSPVTGENVTGDIASKRQGQRQGQGQGQGDSGSEADASASADASLPGATPSVDPEKVMFDQGRKLLSAAGIAPGSAGQLLGKWKRDHGAEAVIVALGKAQREGAIDPRSFIEGCLRNGQRPDRTRPLNGQRGGWNPRPGMEGAEPAFLAD